MPRVEPLQPAFNAGEFSPRLLARTDFAKYRLACRKLENMIPLPHGGAMRRPGTRFVAEAKGECHLIPFEFSTEQAYLIEAGANYLRFYRNQGRIEVADTDAVITNGTFDSGIAGWTDNSTGAAAISFSLVGQVVYGAFEASNVSVFDFGQAATSSPQFSSLRFPVADGGEVVQVKAEVATHSANGAVRCGIYTDVSNAPGTQVGGWSDSLTITGAGVIAFSWSSNAPNLSDDTNYWCVLESTDAALNTQLRNAAWQGGDFKTLRGSTIAGGLGTDGNRSLRYGIFLDVSGASDGALSLDGVAGATAIAEQSVATTATGTEHVLRFRVIGVPGDKIEMQIGEASGGAQILAKRAYGTGYHAVAFMPGASPFFVQFRLDDTAKSVEVDDVSLIDDAPLELATPYGKDWQTLRWAQSADVLYLCFASQHVMRLSRRGHTTWSLEEVRFEDGPYLAQNATATTLTPSATTGLGIAITASATVGINDGAGFQATDVGRLVRILHSSTWGYAVITAVSSEVAAAADVIRDFGATGAVDNWRLGAWSGTTGYPRAVTFHEQRLVLANTTADPDKFWASQTGDFENMRPDSDASGGGVEAQDDDALDYRIASAQVNAIQWLRSGTRLMIGTRGGEWVVDSEGAVVTPADIDVKQQTSVGSAFVDPVQVDNAVLYLQRSQRAIREFAFSFEADGFRSPDLTILSETITQSKIARMAYAANPDSLLLCVREDGRVAALSYNREQDVVGWARWVIGGQFTEGLQPANARVESIAVVPGNDGDGQTFDSSERDEIWFVVKRDIGAAMTTTKRYVEFVEKAFEGPDRNDYDDPYSDEYTYRDDLITAQADAFHVDSGLTYEGSATATITGLGHLEGEVVKVLAQGASHPDRTVSAGTITLDYAVTKAQVGLPYHHDLEPLKLDFGNPAGSAIGREKRVQRVRLVLHETGAIGPDRDALKEVDLRQVAHEMDTAVPLFTGEMTEEIEGDYATDPRIVIRSDAPTPFTLLGMIPEVDVDAS